MPSAGMDAAWAGAAWAGAAWAGAAWAGLSTVSPAIWSSIAWTQLYVILMAESPLRDRVQQAIERDPEAARVAEAQDRQADRGADPDRVCVVDRHRLVDRQRQPERGRDRLGQDQVQPQRADVVAVAAVELE